MDKAVMKVLFRAAGLPVVEDCVVLKSEWSADVAAAAARVCRALPFPLFVKPANLGSSLGISKVRDAAGLEPALATAFEYDRKVIVERAVPDAREIECAVLGNDAPDASVPGEIIPSREFYDYEAKYLDNRSRVIIPAPLDPAVDDEIRRYAIAAFRAIDGSGLARVDFLLSQSTGELVVNEINTLPGFTTISMYAKLWAAMQMDLTTLIDRLITLAIDRHAERQRVRMNAF
jgi:D-alanine-D-alanine ligase